MPSATSSAVGGIEIVGANMECQNAQDDDDNDNNDNNNTYNRVPQHEITETTNTHQPHPTPQTSKSSIPPFVIKATIIASLGGILFGYDMGVISGALPELALTFHLSPQNQETIVSFLYLGGGIGAAVGGTMCDYTGRRKTIILTDVLFIFGALLLYVANSYPQILFGRLIVGFAVSVSGIADVSYLHEISPTKWRGSIVSVNEACISLGFLVAYGVSYWIGTRVDLFDVTEGWRVMFGLSALVAVVQMFGMIWFMPESPVWLREQGLMEEAEEALCMIMGNEHDDETLIRTATKAAKEEEIVSPLPSSPSSSDGLLSSEKRSSPAPSYDTMDEKATVATDAITDYASSSSTSSSTFRNGSPQIYNYHETTTTQTAATTTNPHPPTIKLRNIKEPLLTALFLATSQQFVGHSNILNYAPEILHQVGLTSPHDSLGLTLCLGCTKFAVTGLVIWKIEECGRKTLLLGGIGCIGISLAFLSVAFRGIENYEVVDEEEVGSPSMRSMTSVVLSVLGLFGVVVGYAASFGPLTWLLTSEMFPPSIRGRALGMSTIVTYVSASLISYTFLSGQRLLGPSGPFTIYGVICLVSWVFVWVAVPDTGGSKSPEEIEREMRSMWFWRRVCRCGGSRCHHRVKRRNIPEGSHDDEVAAREEEWDIEAVGLDFGSTANHS